MISSPSEGNYVLSDQGIHIARFNESRLMKMCGLNCKQPGLQAYIPAKVEDPSIKNYLSRRLVYFR